MPPIDVPGLCRLVYDSSVTLCLGNVLITFRLLVSVFLQARNVRKDGQKRASDDDCRRTTVHRRSGFVTVSFAIFQSYSASNTFR